MELFPICDENLDISPNLWYSISGIGESPLMRVGHTVVHILNSNEKYDKGKLCFIGGANPSECFNEMFFLDLNTQSWDKFEGMKNFEKGRYEHACFSNKNNQIFIFGGADQEKNFNDIIYFNIEKKNCEKIEIQLDSLPSPRTYHNGVSYKDQLIVYGGGESGKNAIVDEKIYILNPNNKKCISLQIQGVSPGPRHGHVLINHDDQHIYLHGGMNGEKIFNDLWIFDLKKMIWSKIELHANSNCPNARAAHCGINIDKSLYIFGGIGESGNAFDDLWKYDIDLNQWSLVEIFGYKPPPRLDFAYCKVKFLKKTCINDEKANETNSDKNDELKNFLVLHGGMDTEGNIFDDTFIINLK